MPQAKSGFIQIPRSDFTENKWWRKKHVFTEYEAWLDMIQLAQREPRDFYSPRFGTIHLERGEVILSLRRMAERWSWGLKAVRHFISSKPFAAQVRAQRETQAGTIYLLVNYDLYQPVGSEGAHQRAHSGAQQGHSEGHTATPLEEVMKGTAKDTRTRSKEELLTTTTSASDDAAAGEVPPRKPKAEPKFPDYSKADRQRLHKEWSMTKGEISFTRYVKATGPLFPRYTVDQISAAQALAIAEAKQSHSMRFLTPETFVGSIVDLVERVEKDPVVDGWFADWSDADAGFKRRAG